MEPRETDRGAFAPEVVAQTANETLRLLSGRVLLLDDRLQRLEKRVEEHDMVHVRYMESVSTLRAHFDSELATIRSTHQTLVTTVGDVRTVVVQINNLLRQEDNGLSLMAWRQTTEKWIDTHADLHRLAQERRWKVGLDVAAKVVLWLLAGAVVILAAHFGLGGKL